MMVTRPEGRRRQPCRNSDVKQFLHELISNCEHPDQLVELLYWSREPELAQTMRQLVARDLLDMGRPIWQLRGYYR